MGAGLQIINDFGVVQLDANYFNLEFKYKFQNTVAAGVKQYWLGTNGYKNEVIAVGQTNGCYVNVARTSSNQICVTSFANAATNLTFYVFGVPEQGGGGNCGFQIFNETGQRVFAYDKSYMRVVRAYRTTDNVESAGGRNVVNLGSGTYAAVNSSNRRLMLQHVEPYSGPPRALKVDALSVNGGMIDATPQWKVYPSGQGGWATAYRNDVGGWVTVIDVSGL